MVVGRRIKHIRNLRGMTQKELGMRVGFDECTADIRIAQYENEKRKPKDNLVAAIAQALGVMPATINVPNIDNPIGIMHTMFALEDLFGFKVQRIDDNVCITLGNNKAMESDFFAWCEMSEKVEAAEIQKEDYDQWRYNYRSDMQEVKYCDRCGEKITGAGLYCSACGKKVKK